MRTLIIHIKTLLQVREPGIDKVSGTAMAELPYLEEAYLLVENDIILDYGLMRDCPVLEDALIIDAQQGTLLPSWIDSHTHLVYAGNRVQEFVDRINGLSYAEIAQRGGGILNSAARLNAMEEEQLYRESAVRLEEIIRQGTGAVEIKSGYGLTVEGELKMLRVIQRLRENYPMTIKATFLGAHALPHVYKDNREGYLQLIEALIPQIAEEKLADYLDVFCETDYFTVAETERLMAMGNHYGLQPKIHVNQFTAIGGIAAAVRHNALSVDHLELVTEEDLAALQGAVTMPVALPSCSYFISIPYTPARQMLQAGLPLALASDFNPGTSPSGNMNFVVATACIKMKMTPEEAINAATINAAYAMGISATHGSITRGKKANFILTQPNIHYHELPYAFGSNRIAKVFLNGALIP
ncbi:imidazolonepropionase [Flavobacterium fontis]|uniref:Imidazolonepropionase n=1 Tax=Flavobacterium fontis TaxID=1124188 RepID=A0A1M4Z246_9FLAO|nr:imidazolonepropionase [Flavobacterium fontis]SHF12139.1 imidazolonepropionase [Flavobacterium fontis]